MPEHSPAPATLSEPHVGTDAQQVHTVVEGVIFGICALPVSLSEIEMQEFRLQRPAIIPCIFYPGTHRETKAHAILDGCFAGRIADRGIIDVSHSDATRCIGQHIIADQIARPRSARSSER